MLRRLAADHPTAYEPGLASALNNLSLRLAEADRRDKGLAAIEEAVKMLRRLAAAHPAAHEPYLANTLNTLSSRLAEAGRLDEGLAACEEAVKVRRRLAAAHPTAYEPGLASALNNLSLRLAEAGRRDEGLAAIEEAVEMYRRLAAAHPTAYEPDLADALDNLAAQLADAGRRDEGLAAIEEAVKVRRRLAAAHPTAYEPGLASALDDLSARLAEADQHRQEEGLAAINEAVKIHRRLAVGYPAVSEPPLAMAEDNLPLGRLLLISGDSEQARPLLEDAVSSGDRRAVPLAQANLGGLLLMSGDPEQARPLLEAAIRSGDRRAVPLAQANLGGLLLMSGDPEQARPLLEDAVSSGDRQAVPLAQANLGGLLLMSGDLEQARPLLEAAVRSMNPRTFVYAAQSLSDDSVYMRTPSHGRRRVVEDRAVVLRHPGDQGFLGDPPRLPTQLAKRPDLASAVVYVLCSGERLMAMAGVGGAGKSTLAAQVCSDQRLRRRFRDGIVWLKIGSRKDPVALLADLAQALALPDTVTGFATVVQGRAQLAAALHGRHVLVVADNVWDRGPLDALTGLTPTCAVLFTTRSAELATLVNATQIRVGGLTKNQALELLSHWTNQIPAALADSAQTLCTRIGNLALGITMIGVMVAQGRPLTDLLAMMKQYPVLVPTDPEPVYSYQALCAAIAANISELSEASQIRCAQLAVFAGRGPFSRHAARALWQPELSDVGTVDLLAELAVRSLLTDAGEGDYGAHDLQYDVFANRLGANELAAAHLRLVEGYRIHYPSGWVNSAADPYLARSLASHLHGADLGEELRALLTDPAWIQARLTHGQVADLIPDYGYSDDPLTRQIFRALRRSARALAADPSQVGGQLVGRLLGHPDPGVTAWAADLARHGGPNSWLVPLTPALTSTTDPLERVLSGHADRVRSVAVTADGSRVVSGSEDGSVRVWDLVTGMEQVRLTGHVGRVFSVAVTPDGSRAVSGGYDGSLRVWDLATGLEQARLTGHDGWVRSVAVTANGSRAVSGGGDDGSVRVWDLATGLEQARLTGHAGPVSSVAVTPDGSRAVSGGGDGSVRVWDLTTGTQVARWDGDFPIIGCTLLSGRPLRIGVRQGQGPPYILEFRDKDEIAPSP